MAERAGAGGGDGGGVVGEDIREVVSGCQGVCTKEDALSLFGGVGGPGVRTKEHLLSFFSFTFMRATNSTLPTQQPYYPLLPSYHHPVSLHPSAQPSLPTQTPLSTHDYMASVSRMRYAVANGSSVSSGAREART